MLSRSQVLKFFLFGELSVASFFFLGYDFSISCCDFVAGFLMSSRRYLCIKHGQACLIRASGGMEGAE